MVGAPAVAATAATGAGERVSCGATDTIVSSVKTSTSRTTNPTSRRARRRRSSLDPHTTKAIAPRPSTRNGTSQGRIAPALVAMPELRPSQRNIPAPHAKVTDTIATTATAGTSPHSWRVAGNRRAGRGWRSQRSTQ